MNLSFSKLNGLIRKISTLNKISPNHSFGEVILIRLIDEKVTRQYFGMISLYLLVYIPGTYWACDVVCGVFVNVYDRKVYTGN